MRACADPTSLPSIRQRGPAESRSVRKRHPPTGDPLEERPTGTSVTPQANTPNDMDHPVCRNFVDSPKRRFRASSWPGRADPMPDATRRGNRLLSQQRHRRCGQALTAKLTANRSDSHRSTATPANRRRPFTCADGRQRTARDERGRVRSSSVPAWPALARSSMRRCAAGLESDLWRSRQRLGWSKVAGRNPCHLPSAALTVQAIPSAARTCSNIRFFRRSPARHGTP
jgi:hypothetical protein